MDIKNPYRTAEQIGTENPTAHFNFLKSVVFDEGVQAALSALKPKKFADELPEEEQLVIVLSETHLVSESFHFKKELVSGNMCSFGYGTHSHWMPFPELE